MTHRGVHRARRLRRAPVITGIAALVLAGGGLAAATAGAAPADPAPTLNISYQVMGKTLVAKQNLLVDLGHTQISAVVQAGNHNPYALRFTADLPLPPAKVSFDAFGLIPTTATVVFTQVGKVDGGLLLNKTVFTERSRATYEVSLRDVTVSGKPADVGDACQTIDPVVVHASSPTGKTFDITGGGTITSRYAIGDFQNCGAITDLVNTVVPGGGNFISLTLSQGKITS